MNDEGFPDTINSHWCAVRRIFIGEKLFNRLTGRETSVTYQEKKRRGVQTTPAGDDSAKAAPPSLGVRSSGRAAAEKVISQLIMRYRVCLMFRRWRSERGSERKREAHQPLFWLFPSLFRQYCRHRASNRSHPLSFFCFSTVLNSLGAKKVALTLIILLLLVNTRTRLKRKSVRSANVSLFGYENFLLATFHESFSSFYVPIVAAYAS